MISIGQIYNPILRHFRKPRIERFCARFEITEHTRVLDVGGSRSIWELAPVMPRLSVVNLYGENVAGEAQYIRADGCSLPFSDGAFDVVFCNSVIEHLGDEEGTRKFSAEIRRVGVRYWVQTPDRHFPIEPHYLAPLIHYFPKSWQKRLFRYGTGTGLLTKPSKQEIAALVDELYPLSLDQLAQLFPDGEVEIERFLGMSKSLVAYR
jgi:hypothetical protein